MAGYHIEREMQELGQRVRGWRMVLGLTAQQVSERAEISRTTLRKIEAGDGSVSFNSVAQVLRAIGKLDDVVDALAVADPASAFAAHRHRPPPCREAAAETGAVTAMEMDTRVTSESLLTLTRVL